MKVVNKTKPPCHKPFEDGDVLESKFTGTLYILCGGEKKLLCLDNYSVTERSSWTDFDTRFVRIATRAETLLYIGEG